MKHKKIFIFDSNFGESFYWRLGLPAKQLIKLGYDITISNEIDITQMVCRQLKSLYDFDILFFQIVWQPELISVIGKLMQEGKTVVIDVDDDYYSMPATINKNYLQKDIYGNTRIDYLRRALNLCSIIQCTTPVLADLYGKSKSVVMPPFIDNSIYNTKKIQHDKFTIGWYGTKRRYNDLMILKGCVPDDSIFRIAGYPEANEEIFKSNNIKVTGRFDISQLPIIISECDLGVVPAVDNSFNRGKDDGKCLEFAAGHCPVIASDIAPYRNWIEKDINGYLAKNGKDFIKYINKIKNDNKLLDRLSINAKQKAIKRDITSNISKWIDTYNLIRK